MSDAEILNRINRAEGDVWSVFAQHHDVSGHALVYDVLNPTHLWSNSIYTQEPGHRFQLTDVNMLETFYQVHGLEGFLRDFHGDFRERRIATFTYMYFDPKTSTALASPSTLTMHRCAAGELGVFAEAARLCYARGPDFIFSFNKRMERTLRRFSGTFLLFKDGEDPAAVTSLIHCGGISRLVHFAVRPDARRKGLGREVLQRTVAACANPVFGASDAEKLVDNTFPAAGFRPLAKFDVIPLYSLLR